MSRIPFLDRLGDSFESAVAGRSGERRGPLWVAATAFIVVLVAGGAWLLIRPAEETATATSAASTTMATEVDVEQPPDPVGFGPVPSVWARVPAQGSLDQVSLSGIAAWRGGYVAVGSASDSDPEATTGVVLSSPDGVEWDVAARYEGVSLHDVAAGESGLMAVGIRFDPSDEGGLPVPVVVASEDGSAFSPVRDLPISADGVTFARADAVAAWQGGFVAGGAETEEGSATTPWRTRPAFWFSPDGAAWTAAVVSSEWHPEAAVEDVTVVAGSLVAVGLVSVTEQAVGPAVWVSPDGQSWDGGAVGASAGFSGHSGMSGVAMGRGGLVAVGFAPNPAGTTGAVWRAGDGGGPWERVPDPDGLFSGEGYSSTRIHGVTASANGYIAVGATLERPFGAYMLWTSVDGDAWQRLRLEDPGREDGMVAAFDAASDDAQVVVVGRAGDLAGSAASGAVWVGPAPSGLTPSVAAEVAAPEETGGLELSIDPGRAVGATRVWVRGRITGNTPDEDPVPISLVAEDGTRFLLCEAPLVASRFECRTRLADALPGLVEGSYGVAAGDDEAGTETTLEVLPEGSTVVTLLGVYNRTLWPLLQSIGIRNHGAEPVDLEGWTLADSRRSQDGFTLPAGTIVEPGSSFTVDFSGPGGGLCPESTPRYLHWCQVAGDGGRIFFADDEYLWQGGDMVLSDLVETVQASWTPPR